MYPKLEKKRDTVNKLLTAGGYGSPEQLKHLGTRMLNWVGFANLNIVQTCEETQDQCYSTYNTTDYQLEGLDRVDYRSWPYQYCTQWGTLCR